MPTETMTQFAASMYKTKMNKKCRRAKFDQAEKCSICEYDPAIYWLQLVIVNDAHFIGDMLINNKHGSQKGNFHRRSDGVNYIREE